MNKYSRFILPVGLILISIMTSFEVIAQSKKKILVDVAHGQRFWHDPNDMPGKDPDLVMRVKYMAGELTKNAESLNATVSYQKSKFTAAALQDVDLLFMQGAGGKFDESEVSAIRQ